MFVNGTEIFARVHFTGNRLFTLSENGDKLNEQVYEDTHDDNEIVWYEDEFGNQFDTLEDAIKKHGEK